MNRTDTHSQSYKIALESFSTMALDQPPRDRLTYRNVAMEAITGPDAGMVMDKLYKSVESRAAVNFGRIPDSAGDLTKFRSYHTIVENLNLLNRQLGEYASTVEELKLTQNLYDAIIKYREDFQYGFRTGSQFIITTYNTMVYSLCEMLSLCDVIYVGALKSSINGAPFTRDENYMDLLLCQNVQKFVSMTTSGEWANIMMSLRKDVRNLTSVTIKDDSMGDFMHFLTGTALPMGVGGKYLSYANKIAKTATPNPSFSNTMHTAFIDLPKDAAKKLWNSSGFGKAGMIIMGIAAALLIVRRLLFTFYTMAYKLDEILDDNEQFLKAHIDHNYDDSGATKSLEKQASIYNSLASLQNKMRDKIFKSDAMARDKIRKSNAEEFAIQKLQPVHDSGSGSAGSDFSIG